MNRTSSFVIDDYYSNAINAISKGAFECSTDIHSTINEFHSLHAIINVFRLRSASTDKVRKTLVGIDVAWATYRARKYLIFLFHFFKYLIVDEDFNAIFHIFECIAPYLAVFVDMSLMIPMPHKFTVKNTTEDDSMRCDTMSSCITISLLRMA